MLDCQIDKTIANFFGVLSQGTNGLSLPHVIELRHQRRIEIFGEKHKIALITGHRINKELYLFEHVIKSLIGTHLPLDKSHTHGCLLVYIRICRRLIIDVIPLKQCCTMLGLLIIRQIIAHHTAYVEIIGELESQNRIIDFTGTYLFDIFLGAHRIGIFIIIRNTPAKHDRLQIQLLTKFLAIFVHTACQTQSPIIGMDKYFYAIQDVSLRVVRIKGFIAGYFGVGVISLYHIVIYDNGKCTTDNLVIDNSYNLSFRENSDQRLDLFSGPEHILFRIHAGKRLSQLGIVVHLQVTDFYFINFLYRFHVSTV